MNAEDKPFLNKKQSQSHKYSITLLFAAVFKLHIFVEFFYHF